MDTGVLKADDSAMVSTTDAAAESVIHGHQFAVSHLAK